MYKRYTQFHDKKVISSFQTIITYESCLKNYFNILTFTNVDKDIESLKKLKKSNDVIVHTIKAIIFYIKYNLGWKVNIIPEVQEFIEKTEYLNNPSKINKKIKAEDYFMIIKFYQNKIKKLNGEILHNKNMKKDEKDKGEYPKWKNLINIDYKHLTDDNKHIYKVYTLMPCRRLSEYVNMVFVFDKKNIKIIKDINKRNKRLNYCYLNLRNPKESFFVYQKYKNDRHFNRPVIIKLWSKMYNYLLSYVKKNNTQNYDKFINSYSVQDLHNRLKRIFNHSVDVLRHSYIQFIYTQYKKGTINYDKLCKISRIMGHSLNVQLDYNFVKL